MPLPRFLDPGRSKLGSSLVSRMDEIPGVEIAEVDLPRDPAPDPTSRTIQPTLHPNFTRHYLPPTYPLRVAEIPHGRLVLSGGVVAPDGRLVEESLWDEWHYRRDFASGPKLAPATRLAGRGASIISMWGDNYFHWIFNSLPRIAVLLASEMPFDYLIVPEQLRPFQSQTLELLGYGADRLMPFSNQHVEVENLIWAAPLAPINEPSQYLLEWTKAKLRPRVETPTRRLYVSRSGGTRRAVNEEEIYGRLEPLGYEFVLPEQYSFTEQVELFGQARVATGPHGSNFVSAIFSEELSVFEYFQPEHVNWGVYSVLCAAGQDHWNILCESVRRYLGPKRFADMTVPWPLVEETLRRIDSEVQGAP